MRNVIIGTEGKVTVSDIDAFRHYRKNAKHRNMDNTSKDWQYKKLIVSLYGKVARDLVEKEGGVFIKDLGYFTILRHPRKQVVKVNYKGGMEFFNTKTNNYLWLPTFFGFGEGRGLLKFWTMDRTFSDTHVKQKLHERLINGKTYKTFIATLSSLYLFKKSQ